MLTCPKTLTHHLDQPLSSCNSLFHGQNRTCIHIHPDNVWTISHILYSYPPLLRLSSQGPVAPTQWVVQVVWVRARGALSVCPPTCQPPTRGKEHSQMTSINWWTTGQEMPWTSHRFTAVFYDSSSCIDIENVHSTMTHWIQFLVYQTRGQIGERNLTLNDSLWEAKVVGGVNEPQPKPTGIWLMICFQDCIITCFHLELYVHLPCQ